jgi:hypothetical protein
LPQNLLVDELKLAEIGPEFEHREMFPARTNTGQVSLFLWSEYGYQLYYDIYLMYLLPQIFISPAKGFLI